MKAIEAAAQLAIAIIEGKFEFGEADEGLTLTIKYTGKDLDQEGDLLQALLYLVELDGLTVRSLRTDGIHVPVGVGSPDD